MFSTYFFIFPSYSITRISLRQNNPKLPAHYLEVSKYEDNKKKDAKRRYQTLITSYPPQIENHFENSPVTEKEKKE